MGTTFGDQLSLHKSLAFMEQHSAVDWDVCVGDGVCIDVCPVSLYEWAETPGNASSEKKSDPAREKDCIQCLACELQCPTQAIKITPP